MKKNILIFSISLIFGFSVLFFRNYYESRTGETKSHWNVINMDEGDSKNFVDRGFALSQGYHYFYGCEKAPIVAFYRPPGYPIFLAMVFKLFGISFKTVIVLQIFIASFIIVLISVITKILFKNNIISWIAGILAILYYPMWNDAMIINSELLSMLLGLLSLYFILEYYFDENNLPKNLILSGVFAGLASLTRGQFLFYSILLVIFIFSIPKMNPGRKIKMIFIWSFFTFISLAAWSVYAYLSSGIVMFISTQGPYSIWWGWSPLVVLEENYPIWNPLWDKSFINDDMIGFYLSQKSSSWFLNEAYSFIIKYPADSLKIAYFKFLDCWGFADLYSGNSIISKLLKVIKLNWDFFLAIPGFILLWKQKENKIFTSYSLYAGILFSLVSILTAGLIRYRIPFLDPLLIILASYTVYKIYTGYILKNKLQQK